MNERIEKEIREQIESIKKLKMAVGEINNHLSILEGFCREDKQKWINNAYEDGYKDGKNSIDNGCKGCKHEGEPYDKSPCEDCCNSHHNQYEPMPKYEICFGDEVVDRLGGEKGIVVSRNNTDEMIWVLLKGWNVPQKIYKSSCRKTGIHRDIDSYFEEI